MATIRTAIALYDGVTSPLKSMHKAINIVINSFETMQRTSGKSVDTRAIQEAREELARAGAAFDSIEQNIRDANNQQQRFNRNIHNGTTAAGGLWDKLKGAATAIGTATGLKKLVELSDDMTSTKARLNLIVDDGGSVEALEKQIMASAQRSRSYYMDTASAVAKLGLNAKDAFGSMDEVIGFSELINKQFVIGGASAQEQSAAMLQLTQAMASGVLRGDELRSVFEQAPGIVQNIADYLDVPIGQIRDMAAEGQITADIVKNAMFNAADDINAQFETMPMTWGQVGTIFSNIMLQTFDPLIQAVGRGAQFVYDNWSTIEPIFWGLAAAVGAYAVALGVQTAATWIATGAAKTFFTTLLSNPLFWIALAIGVVVGAIYKWVQSVGGLEVAWLMCSNALLTAWDWVKIGFFTGIYWVLDLWDKLKLGIMSAGVAIQNYMGDMKAGVLMILQNMVNGAIGIINDFISMLNKLPGVSIDLISQVTFGTTAQLENAAEQAARNANLEAYRSEIEANIAGRDAALNQMRNDALAATAEREANIATVRANALAQQNEADNPLEGIYDKTSAIADNTAAMGEALNIAEEDLAYLRDIAEREAINRFTTAEIRVEQHNENHISKDIDLDGIMDIWATDFAARLDISEEGVHA